MDAYVWHKKLDEAIPSRSVKTDDHEIERIRHLECVDLDDGCSPNGPSRKHRVAAPQAHVDRWRAATEAMLSAHRSVEQRRGQAWGRQWPPAAVRQRMAW